MGLENGINIVRSTKLPAITFDYFDEEWRARNNFDLEVAYWRKCWNVRNVLMRALSITEDNDSMTPMDVNDVNNAISSLRGLNKKNWNDYGGTIWSWSEFKKIQRRNIRNLRRLRRLMKKYPGVFEVYFYDSW